MSRNLRITSRSSTRRPAVAALAGLAMTAIVGLSAGSASASSAVPAPSPVSVTFGYTGSSQMFTVPTYATDVKATVNGAQGGGARGGLGARVYAQLYGVEGQTLQINVGGRGSAHRTGGWNGGGSGGNGGGADSSNGAGGGGASDIRFHSHPSHRDDGTPYSAAKRIVVAGGGGGTGGDYGTGLGGAGGKAPAYSKWGASGVDGWSGETTDYSGTVKCPGGAGGGAAEGYGPSGEGGEPGRFPDFDRCDGSTDFRDRGWGADGGGVDGGAGSDAVALGTSGAGGGGGGGFGGGGGGGGGQMMQTGGGGGGGAGFIQTEGCVGTSCGAYVYPYAQRVGYSYGEDGVQSGDGSVVITYTPKPVASSLTASCTPNPTIYPKHKATCTVTVKGPGSAPTGDVEWATSGAGRINLYAAPRCTLTAGTCSVIYQPAASDVSTTGSVTMTARYLGDPGHLPSTGQTALPVRITPSTTALTSSAAPVVPGQPVTFTATVTAPDRTPSGRVVFKDGTTTLGSSLLNKGRATLTLSTLGAGRHSITAVYEGDPYTAASTSAPLVQQVGLGTVTAVTTPATTVRVGTDVGLTVTVRALDTMFVPTGTVALQIDGQPYRTAVQVQRLGDATASVVVPITFVAAGEYTVTATFQSDGMALGSASQPLVIRVS